MRKFNQVKTLKKMRKLSGKVLAACAVSSTLLLVNGGTVYAQFTDNVYGGSFITEEQSTATVNGKAVSIPGGKYSVDEYTAEIAGSYVKITNQLADSVAITNGNTVSITGGSFHGSIAGGFADVTLPENKDVITGAGGGKAQADNNTVTISGAGFYSQSNSDISGGFARNLNFGDAQANGNTVEIDNIEITVRLDGSALLTRSIYGGYATGSSNGSTTANDNKLTISGANIKLMPNTLAERDLNGIGYSASNIYAGYATNGTNNTANSNTLTISGVTISNYVGDSRIDEYSNTEIGGGEGYNGTANYNKVVIIGGLIGEASEDDSFNNKNVNVYGGNGGKEAKGNEVVIDGSASIFGKVAGGFGSGESSTVEGNAVTIATGTVTGSVYGGEALSGTVKGNKITITGGTIFGDVYGGESGNYGVAENNAAVIAGGTVNGDVIGGATFTYAKNATPNSSGNSVTLGNANGEGTATVTGDVYVQRHEVGEIYTLFDEEKIDSLDGAVIAAPGGSLNVYNTGNNVSGNVNAPGANVNFNVKESNLDASEPMLTVGGNADFGNAKVVAHVDNLGTVAGSSINLLKAKSITNTGATYTITDDILDNSSLECDAGSIKATKIDPSKTTVNENAKSPAETQIVGVALVNAALDALASDGFSEAAKVVNGTASEMQPFATMGGSVMRQNSGSYVDVRSWNAGLGFAKAVANNSGKLLFGPIAQYGRGNYDSYLNNGTQGSGKSSFYGLGGMIKQENNNGVYCEGSVMLGRLKNDYNGKFGTGMNYDDSANFYAMHAGIGKVQELKKDVTLDYYGKLFFTHQNGNSVKLGSGHIYDFDDVNSIRSRVGVRFAHQLSEGREFYAGMAWQHEFDSKVQATIHAGMLSLSAPAPSVKGETGIFELGWKEKPVNSNLETNVGVIGSIGKQRGVGFNAQLNWKF